MLNKFKHFTFKIRKNMLFLGTNIRKIATVSVYILFQIVLNNVKPCPTGSSYFQPGLDHACAGAGMAVADMGIGSGPGGPGGPGGRGRGGIQETCGKH
jgi:hypothetical protein